MGAEMKATIIKGGMKMLPVVGPSELCVNPIFEIGPLEPRYSEYLVFEGICVDEKGVQHYLDASLAYKRAILNCIKYLAQFGYTEYQIYLLLPLRGPNFWHCGCAKRCGDSCSASRHLRP